MSQTKIQLLDLGFTSPVFRNVSLSLTLKSSKDLALVMRTMWWGNGMWITDIRNMVITAIIIVIVIVIITIVGITIIIGNGSDNKGMKMILILILIVIIIIVE